MFNRILVANRGEIACRIIKTAKKLGLYTVAVFSESDSNSPHVSMADEKIFIGPGPSSESYLSFNRILDAAKLGKVEAIHPGYGFLSENAEFAQACVNAGFVFIGPPAKTIALMANKTESKRKVTEAGIPCLPGYGGEDQSKDAFLLAAEGLGFPVMLKAADGGGGRGIRLVKNMDQLSEIFELARAEAATSFSSNKLILEKAILSAHHVEIQICADTLGNIVHLGERDCSIQRRHQKIIEEAPCPVMTKGLRASITMAAVKVAKLIKYSSLGTVEFLLDSSGNFYFLEMNTRLQVEHPVTEMVTGIDLVATQIAIAQGKPLPFTQADYEVKGHAMEARLYAEDPEQDFFPTNGRIVLWSYPTGSNLRVDAGICTGIRVSTFYDSMLAKVIVWGENRNIARKSLIEALGNTAIFGPITNRDYLIGVLGTHTFSEGMATTTFVSEQSQARLQNSQTIGFKHAAMAAVLRYQKQTSDALNSAGHVPLSLVNWASIGQVESYYYLKSKDKEFRIIITPDGKRYSVRDKRNKIIVAVVEYTKTHARLCVEGDFFDLVHYSDKIDTIFSTTKDTFYFRDSRLNSEDDKTEDFGRYIEALVPGRVVEICAAVGQDVVIGERLIVIEAMKMHHSITASSSGRVAIIHTKLESQVEVGEILIEISEKKKKTN